MNQTIRKGIIGGVLIITLILGIYWIQQYLQRSRASATAPTTSFSIIGPKVNPGEVFDLILSINPNLTPFYSFDLAFTYDAMKVEPGEITPLSTKGTDLVDVVLLKGVGSTNIDTAAHTIRISGIRATGASDPFIGRNPIQMVKVSFVMKKGVELPLDFKWIDPEPGKISISDSFEKKNISYTGEEPTATPAPTGIGVVGVPTSTPVPGIVQPTLAYNSLTPVPTVIGGSGVEATTTSYTERKDLLYINSIASYQSPFRYEQGLKLEAGAYTLKMGAKVYVKRGRGLLLVILCNSTVCGDKKKGDSIYVSPVFPAKTEFSEMTESVGISSESNYILRIFCEDGSECELDYISLEDAWGSERIVNMQFQSVDTKTDPRKQPTNWEVDDAANLYGSVDSAFGKNGALMINNSIK
jgi:hypothetical protein